MHWKCSVCQLLWDGEAPPDVCPKCGNPKDKYVHVTDHEWGMVERSRFTNALHVELLGILPNLVRIADKGLEDNLDPWCVSIFKRLKDEATFLEKSVKAEINGHVNKGKWG